MNLFVYDEKEVTKVTAYFAGEFVRAEIELTGTVEYMKSRRHLCKTAPTNNAVSHNVPAK